MKATSKLFGEIEIQERDNGGYTLISDSAILLFPDLEWLLAYADVTDALNTKLGVFVVE